MAILEESCGSKLVNQTTTHTTLLITSCNVLTNLKASAIITLSSIYHRIQFIRFGGFC